jgi:hypothetical protein
VFCHWSPQGVNALVEDAFAVVADVEVVVDGNRLVHVRRFLAIRRVVVAWLAPVAPGGVGRRSEPIRRGAVFFVPARHIRRDPEVDGGAQQLEHEAAAEACPLGIGAHDHAGFNFPRAGGHQHLDPSNSTTHTGTRSSG